MDKEIKISFEGGLDKDTSKNKYRPNTFYDAQNLRLTTKQGLSNFALENIEGIETKIELVAGTVLLGYCIVREKVYYFTLATATSKLQLSSFDKDNPTIITDYFVAGGLTTTLTSSSVIKAIGRYESLEVQKIYWVEPTSPIRYANVAPSNILTGVNDISHFDMLPNFSLAQAEITNIVGGNLYAGTYEYAYQFYNKNGAETLFSPVSKLISITSSSENLVTDQQYKGSSQGTNCGKGIQGTITNTNLGFNKIRIVAIQYEAFNAAPKIRIFEDKDIISTDTSTINFYDGGDNLGELTVEEFLIVNDSYFKAKEIETKDNTLFVANIESDHFDFEYDARAYRYLNDVSETSIYTVLWHDSGKEYILRYSNNLVFTRFTANSDYVVSGADVSTATYTLATVPKDFDCFNKYNDSVYERNNPEALVDYCKYQSDGTIYGGEGLNIKYEILSKDVEITALDSINYESTLESSVTNPSYYSFASPYNSSNYRGYQRDEVYRFGIEGFDVKGRKSPVKWIGDIKINNGDLPFDDAPVANETLAKIVYINFLVEHLPTEVVAYRIVRVKRELNDRSVLMAGLLNSVVYNARKENLPTTTQRYQPIYGLIGYSDYADDRDHTYNKLAQFISPEVNFNTDISWKNDDFLKMSYKYPGHTHPQQSLIQGIEGTLSIQLIAKMSWVEKINDLYHDISDFKKIPYTLNSNIDTALNYFNGTTEPFVNAVQLPRDGDPEVRRGSGGTTLILNFNGNNQELTFAGLTSYNASLGYDMGDCYYAYYKRDNTNQYGGHSFTDRKLNEYIPCSEITLVATNTVDVFQGDIFSGFFDYLKTVFSLDEGVATDEGLHEEVYIPVETSINLNLRHDDNFHRIRDITNSHAIHETAGLYQAHDDTRYYTQLTDLYLYNSVYSQESSTQINLADNDETLTTKFDVRIKYSDTKTNNEYIDSWTKFRVGNYKEVDTRYGEINNLVNFRNQILYFQNTGFGMLSINPRSLIEDNNVGVITLGKGNVLERFDYLSTEIGNTNPWGITFSEKALYWGDNARNELFQYTDGVKCISRDKGVHSQIVSLTPTNIVCGTDRNFGEILFTIDDLVTLVYNEDVDAFVSTYKYIPKIYISLTDKLFSYKTTIFMNLIMYPVIKEHNSLDINRCLLNYDVLGNVDNSEDSYITLLVNPEQNKTCRFDVFEFLTELFDGSTEVLSTIDSIRIWNNYQDSGTITINSSNIKQRFRTWRFNTIRDSVNSRFKDSYIFVKLTFNNHDNYRFILHDVNIKYSIIAPR